MGNTITYNAADEDFMRDEIFNTLAQQPGLQIYEPDEQLVNEMMWKIKGEMVNLAPCAYQSFGEPEYEMEDVLGVIHAAVEEFCG